MTKHSVFGICARSFSIFLSFIQNFSLFCMFPFFDTAQFFLLFHLSIFAFFKVFHVPQFLSFFMFAVYSCLLSLCFFFFFSGPCRSTSLRAQKIDFQQQNRLKHQAFSLSRFYPPPIWRVSGFESKSFENILRIFRKMLRGRTDVRPDRRHCRKFSGCN